MAISSSSILNIMKSNDLTTGERKMCEQKFGGLLDDPERLERYQKLFAEAFPGKTALDVLHRNSRKGAE
jgi:hypothetical protein